MCHTCNFAGHDDDYSVHTFLNLRFLQVLLYKGVTYYITFLDIIDLPDESEEWYENI